MIVIIVGIAAAFTGLVVGYRIGFYAGMSFWGERE